MPNNIIYPNRIIYNDYIRQPERHHNGNYGLYIESDAKLEFDITPQMAIPNAPFNLKILTSSNMESDQVTYRIEAAIPNINRWFISLPSDKFEPATLGLSLIALGEKILKDSMKA